MVTIKQMVSLAGDEVAPLIRAVVKQSGGIEVFNEQFKDIANHGVSGGFSGWIYYTETTGFYAKNKKQILILLQGMAQELGNGPVLELVKSFNGTKDFTEEEIAQTLYGTKKQHDTQVANLLAWVACEEVCQIAMRVMEGE